MNKLSLDALKERANSVTSEDLLISISGGTENACHDSFSEAVDAIPDEVFFAQMQNNEFGFAYLIGWIFGN